jgi:hypothetical protein
LGFPIAVIACSAGVCLAVGTVADCWNEFKDRIRVCGNLATHEQRVECNKAANDILTACLGNTPEPNPTPTTDSCFSQLITDLQNCVATFPYPDNPSPPKKDTRDWDRYAGCLTGAYSKFKWCFSKVPKAQQGIAAGIPTDVTTGAASFQMTFDVSDAETSQASVWLLYMDPTSISGAVAYQAAVFVGLTEGSYTETIAIPTDVYTNGNGAFDVVVQFVDGSAVTVDAGGAPVHIEWGNDMNMDGTVNVADVPVANEMYAMGLISYQELLDVIAEAGQ